MPGIARAHSLSLFFSLSLAHTHARAGKGGKSEARAGKMQRPPQLCALAGRETRAAVSGAVRVLTRRGGAAAAGARRRGHVVGAPAQRKRPAAARRVVYLRSPVARTEAGGERRGGVAGRCSARRALRRQRPRQTRRRTRVDGRLPIWLPTFCCADVMVERDMVRRAGRLMQAGFWRARAIVTRKRLWARFDRERRAPFRRRPAAREHHFLAGNLPGKLSRARVVRPRAHEVLASV